jgi:hypothetical protein
MGLLFLKGRGRLVCEKEKMGAALVLSFTSKERGKMAGSRGWNS